MQRLKIQRRVESSYPECSTKFACQPTSPRARGLPEHSRWREQVVLKDIFVKLGELGAREFHEQLNLEESGLDPGHSEGDWFNVVRRQSVAPEIVPIQLINWSPQKDNFDPLICLPCKFNIPDIEGILVLDECKALAWAG